MRRFALALFLSLFALSGCSSADRWSEADIRDAVSIADGVYPPQGHPIPTLASLGANLQGVTDEGNTTTNSILTGGGTVGAPGWGWTEDADGSGTGWHRNVADRMALSINGILAAQFFSAGFMLTDSQPLIFGLGQDAFMIGDGSTSGLLMLGTAEGAADGTFSLAALGARAATTDTATVDMVVTAMDAWEQATGGQDTGSDLILAGGLSVYSTEVVDFSQTGYTVTVTVNGTAKVLTEGSASPDGWTNVTSNSVSATALAVEISLISGVTATAVAAVVHITADATVYSLLLAETGTGNTVTNNADGSVVFPGTTSATILNGVVTAESLQGVGTLSIRESDGTARVTIANGGNMNFFNGSGVTVLSMGSSQSSFTKDVAFLDDVRAIFGTGDDYYTQGESTALTDGGSADTIFSIPMSNGDVANVKVTYSIKVVDTSGDIQTEHGTAQITLIDHSTGVVVDSPEVALVRNNPIEETGILTASVWSVDQTDDGSIEVQVLSDSDLTVSTMVLSWKAEVSGVTVPLTVP